MRRTSEHEIHMDGNDEWTGETSRWGGQVNTEDIWTGMTSGRGRQVDEEDKWTWKTYRRE